VSELIVAAKECVVYDAERNIDSHRAMHDGTYTFVIDGTYIVKDRDGTRQITVKAGETIVHPKRVLGEHCGVFFRAALAEMGRSGE
jgi:hypothetical protein